MKKLFILLGLLYCFRAGFSQAPDWTVNSSAFEFSMAFSGVAEINSVEARDTSDRIAAWIGGETRGVAKPFYSSSTDRYYFFLLVYSNGGTGEHITFSYYDASADTVLTLANVETFVSDKNTGSFSDPYIFTNTANPIPLYFRFTGISDTITIDTTSHHITLMVPDSTDLSGLVAEFSFSNADSVLVNGKTQISGVSANDFTNPVIYAIITPAGEVDWTVTVHAGNTLGIVNLQESGFELYPSPAMDFLFVKADEIRDIEVIDMAGNLQVHQEGGNGGIQKMDVSKLPSGIYLLRVFRGNQMEMKRFIKR